MCFLSKDAKILQKIYSNLIIGAYKVDLEFRISFIFTKDSKRIQDAVESAKKPKKFEYPLKGDSNTY